MKKSEAKKWAYRKCAQHMDGYLSGGWLWEDEEVEQMKDSDQDMIENEIKNIISDLSKKGE